MDDPISAQIHHFTANHVLRVIIIYFFQIAKLSFLISLIDQISHLYV